MMLVMATICHMIAVTMATLPPTTAVHVGTVLSDIICATLFIINIETDNIGGEGTLVRGMEATRMGLESEDRLTCPRILSHLGFYQQNNLQTLLNHHFLKLELQCLEQSSF